MADKSIEIIGTVFDAKLKLAQLVLERLPPQVRPAVAEVQVQILTSLRNSIDRCLKNETPAKCGNGLKKIELE